MAVDGVVHPLQGGERFGRIDQTLLAVRAEQLAPKGAQPGGATLLDAGRRREPGRRPPEAILRAAIHQVFDRPICISRRELGHRCARTDPVVEDDVAAVVAEERQAVQLPLKRCASSEAARYGLVSNLSALMNRSTG